ncbi:MAG: ribosome-associated translation inhibitor RaiA [Candidatus Cloacimonetes bacterium]|nr:ribosome-associated translation inhibitor RaiA [Candidatus Cloacimonadota bacterium]MCF7812901.1 ribosome-associated translation inhibitor RaiA [Candidatus Cloacimonadota bacterium]MCF7867113.1 ribosome-associated translation inhibitor RaiA [Candidatus Cloacimonadota bacterium]MCF7882567.1 ribosome-associated translation inhibitor RaiA [Candidatus Cloacimonadota bacterium]
MQVTITARHFHLTNAIRDHIYDSVSKLERYFDNIITAHFILALENNMNRVELVMHIPKHNLKSETAEKDMYFAIDVAVDKMEQQIKKMKDKWTDHHQKRSLKESSSFVYANLIERGNDRKTIKIKRMLAENMTLNDALAKFDEINDPYLIFKNLETDRVNVLVKKDENHYKLLEP